MQSDERVTGREAPDPHREPVARAEAEGGAAVEDQDRRPAAQPSQQGPLVPRAGEPDLAGLAVEHGAGHGDEHAHVVALGQPAVQRLQDLVGPGLAPADRSQEPGHARHQERGGHALVRHVGDGDDEPATVQQKEVVEIAADLAGRLKRDGDRVPSGQEVGRRRGQHRLLDLPGDVELARPPLLLREPRGALLDVPAEHPAHPVRHVPERAHLQRVPDLGQRGVEVALAHPVDRAGQRLQRPGDAAGREPHEAQGQPEDAEADEELPLGQAPRLGDQLVARRGQEQGQRLPHVHRDRALRADPGSALDREGGVPSRRRAGRGDKAAERGVPEVVEPGETGIPGRPRADQSRRVGMGDHESTRVDEREPRGGGHAGLGEVAGELLERDVGTDDGPAVVASPRERRANLPRREEHVGTGSHERRARHALPVPLAAPRIEAVVGPGLVPDHAELRVQEEVPPSRGAVGAGQALDEEGRRRGRVEASADRVAQRAHEEEVPVPEPDVHGRDLGVRGQGRGEQRERLEPRIQTPGPGDRVPREQLHQQAGRSQQVANAGRGVLGDVDELLVADREQEMRRGAVAVADEGEAGRADERHEQGRDVHPEPEPAAPASSWRGGRPGTGRGRLAGRARPGGIGRRHQRGVSRPPQVRARWSHCPGRSASTAAAAARPGTARRPGARRAGRPSLSAASGRPSRSGGTGRAA